MSERERRIWAFALLAGEAIAVYCGAWLVTAGGTENVLVGVLGLALGLACGALALHALTRA